MRIEWVFTNVHKLIFIFIILIMGHSPDFIFFCFYMCNVMTYTSSWRDILLYALHGKNPLTTHLISNFRKCWSIKDLRKLFALNVCWPCFEHKHWVHFAEQFWQVNWLMVYYVLFLYPLLLWNVSEFQVIVLHIMRLHSTIPSLSQWDYG